ncbi:uncharacterized protein LOC107626935 [Arachis ipaensis]|uniref:uncharacterized protein LOC107626935 n=1 Tax=Arachis ipaensis TaxID=130454 RepID=UPI000A2AFDBD|nr:uncharacterized protein LOC107626935 [Arachis ipaensis]
MVQWQRHFLPVFRQIAHFATTSSPQGKGLTTLTARTILLPSISIRSPVYHSFQSQGISGSTCLLSKSSDLEQTPTSSPLALTSFLGSKEAQDQKQTPVKKERVQAVMSKIKQSPKKVNLVAALVRGMLVKDALLQLQVTVKRASRTVYQGITQAQGNAVNNHGLDAERLIVGTLQILQLCNLICLATLFKSVLMLFHIPCSRSICWKRIIPEESFLPFQRKSRHQSQTGMQANSCSKRNNR